MFILGLLKEFLTYVPNSLTPAEVAQYADKIMAYCPDWTTTDLIICLKNGMDGKYGINKYHWKWNPDFIEWVKIFNQKKFEFISEREEQKKKDGQKADAQIISLFPQHILEKFKKETLTDKRADEALIPTPSDEIIAQGSDAVDAYIEQIRNKINK